ncbi:MAG TPA: hypothetical protein VGL42_05730 [Opitutaceae bacterium]|jgi:hypothetical protein
MSDPFLEFPQADPTEIIRRLETIGLDDRYNCSADIRTRGCIVISPDKVDCFSPPIWRNRLR